ncbi:hypothetical protein [Aliikangiella sp. IMCC44632]
MKNYILALILVCLSGCISSKHIANRDNFKIEFGHIIEAGEFYELDNRGNTIQWEKNKIEPRFGVRVENLSRNGYVLEWTILKFDENSGVYSVFNKAGAWYIGPPTNIDYEAFLWSEGVDFKEGNYLFLVNINGLNAKMFSFNIQS